MIHLLMKADLIEQFIASFERLGEMRASQEIDAVAWELRIEEPDEFGSAAWRAAKTTTDPALLEPIYAKLPARFPPLYERLVLSYRWDTVDLDSYRLLANPPGPDLSPLFAEITRDKGLTESLLPAGYIQFGQGPDYDYDPVCFDIKSRTKSKDYRIVKIDHEEILCNYRVKVVAEIAPSFENLVQQTIARCKA